MVGVWGRFIHVAFLFAVEMPVNICSQSGPPLPFTDEPRLGSDVVLSVAFSSLFVLVNTYSKSDRPSS